MYRCVRCEKCFNQKSDLNRHLRRKNPCQVGKRVEIESRKQMSPQCHYCNGVFYNKQGLKRHMKNPKISCFVLSQIEPIKKEMQSLAEKQFQPQTVIHNKTVNKTVNNIINIQLVQPGDEKIDHITKDDLLEIFKHDNFEKVIHDLMRLIYFNKEVPHNSHWCIAFPKDKYGALQYNTDTALIERLLTHRTINLHFQNMLSIVAEKLEGIIKNRQLDINQLRNINNFYQYIGSDSMEEQNENAFEHVKMLAYNNRSVPISVWKDLELDGEHKYVRI